MGVNSDGLRCAEGILGLLMLKRLKENHPTFRDFCKIEKLVSSVVEKNPEVRYYFEREKIRTKEEFAQAFLNYRFAGALPIIPHEGRERVYRINSNIVETKIARVMPDDETRKIAGIIYDSKFRQEAL
jgi:hypothetical protein